MEIVKSTPSTIDHVSPSSCPFTLPRAPETSALCTDRSSLALRKFSQQACACPHPHSLGRPAEVSRIAFGDAIVSISAKEAFLTFD
jgi:hypothetical protein